MNKSESKYFNTAVRMDEALMSLLEKKDFAYISVKEVCAAAGVNRSTFYLHYETTRDLLEESVKLMHERFLSYFTATPENLIGRMESCTAEELYLITPEYLTPYLTFIRDHRRLYRAALEHPSDFRAEETYRAMFRHIFDPILCRFAVPSEERAYLMSFYLGGIQSVVENWLASDCAAPIPFLVGVLQEAIPRG